MMAGPLAEQVMAKLDEARSLYHRLVILVGPAATGKTAALRELHERLDAPLLNVNLALSSRLLDLAEKQRPFHVQRLLSEIVDAGDADVALLDNIEILFGVALQQDPLRLLQGMSRNRTIVAAWNGVVDGGSLSYAAAGHPEFRQYPVSELLTVNTVNP